MASRQKVLIVEDDEDLRRMYRTALAFARYDVHDVGDGLDALLHLDSNPPDLVVLDLGLPSVSGHVVRQAIAGDPVTRHIPVVVVTGATGDLESLDVTCVLKKPVSPDRLIDAVRTALRQEPGRTAPDTTDGAR